MVTNPHNTPCQIQGCCQPEAEVKYNQGRLENLDFSAKYVDRH